ncbi:Hypothetical protein PHPALM_20008 [Phytophthora palmivora]|uniref:HAT C-terminal dimerisation domain-containing protein n=1 Tax=Phytophthora palmivora TaxID=4796 RepID=A0A2P4XFY4_9STRA|nr:Hypothetical protein PHPALM_20008 [Phytophthora palmivora]
MRTLHQIASRLPEPSVAIGMALLLDPRTKRSAANYLRIPDTSEAATEKILTKAKEGLRTEHRVICEEETSTSTSRSPSGDCNSSSDTELDLLCGEEVTQSTEESVADADAALNAKADELLEQWLNLRIEWDQVAKHQYSDKKGEMVLSRLTIRNRRHRNVRVWNVEQLCQQINVCQWFAESGQARFPSVAKLARVWLGRSCSTAFQKRVFSTGTFVMCTLRTRTDNERAQRQLVLRHNRDGFVTWSKANAAVVR